jgi:microcystin-dependent protein
MARSTLGTIDPTTTSGTQLALMLSNRDIAENSGHLGGGRPSYATAGMIYAESTLTPPHLWLAGVAGDGSQDIDLTLLFADRPGTLRPTAEVRLPAGGWLWCDGFAYARVTYPALYDAICPAFIGTTAVGSAVISGISAADNLDGLGVVGAIIEGPGGLNGLTITATTTNSVTVSGNATSVVTNGTFRVFPHGNGNGSTTFNVPNLKGRSIIARQNMGGTDANIITVAGAGFDGTRLGLSGSGGAQTATLNATQIPPHQHSGGTSLNSGWSGSVGANIGDHYHLAGALNTALSGAAHTHGAGTLAGQVLSRAMNDGGQQVWSSGTANSINIIGSTGTGSANHTHTVGGNTDWSSGTHTHNLSALSFTLNTTYDLGGGGGLAHSSVQPSMIENIVIKT